MPAPSPDLLIRATGVNTYLCGSAPKVVTLDLDNLAVRAG